MRALLKFRCIGAVFTVGAFTALVLVVWMAYDLGIKRQVFVEEQRRTLTSFVHSDQAAQWADSRAFRQIGCYIAASGCVLVLGLAFLLIPENKECRTPE